jgi:hypothetical protein
MTYDPQFGGLLMFGGITWNSSNVSSLLGDTWTFR